MNNPQFKSEDGTIVPSISEPQMREVDRIAVEDFGLSLLQMMENAGRNLTRFVIDFLGKNTDRVITIAAGSGGNGGGGLCCARHLYNHGYQVEILLTKAAEKLQGVAGTQMKIIQNTGIKIHSPKRVEEVISSSDIIIDALIGYSLNGPPRGITKEYIEYINQYQKEVISLDLPSGIDASTGETPGVFIKADCTISLALPKAGLMNPATGKLYLADIGIPKEVYEGIGIHIPLIFRNKYCYRLFPTQ
jgi:NAD(P)H-hydrate epimerase